VAASFKYGAEAFALMGIAYGLIKWVGRTLRSLISDSTLESSRVDALALPAAAADSLVRQGIVSAADLSRMSAREQQFLVASALPQVDGPAARGRSRRSTPISSAPVRNAPITSAARSPVPTPTRLHLITPSRPPLGVAVHCPGCGAPLYRDALQKFGATPCARCKRPVSAHIQRGRLTVIVEETLDEAEHRRRLDGGS
jgi:hypothetical protein